MSWSTETGSFQMNVWQGTSRSTPTHPALFTVIIVDTGVSTKKTAPTLGGQGPLSLSVLQNNMAAAGRSTSVFSERSEFKKVAILTNLMSGPDSKYSAVC